MEKQRKPRKRKEDIKEKKMITLDKDVVIKIEELAKVQGLTFSTYLNWLFKNKD